MFMVVHRQGVRKLPSADYSFSYAYAYGFSGQACGVSRLWMLFNIVGIFFICICRLGSLCCGSSVRYLSIVPLLQQRFANR